ncbi:hypothetical protein WP12_05585 [Sphingomonas sp. SRS2]|nr:hypothetical protein WP12_05585 [Sphingomonas sp. SRS2]
MAASGQVPLRDGRSSKVALSLGDPAKVILGLIALDGIASRILLLSPGMVSSEFDGLISEFDPDLIVTDNKALQSEGAVVTLWSEEIASVAERRSAPRPRICSTQWVFATSGTTGRPKLVEHSFASLSRATRPSKPGVETVRWGQLYEITRFAGIQVMLQGLAGGGALLLPNRISSLSAQLRLLAEWRCTALSATPTLWRKILLTGDRPKLDLRQITLGGEIADDAVLTALKREFTDARITHVYASTEAGAALAVHDGRAGFPESYLRNPPSGIVIKINDARLYVHNHDVTGKYLGSGQSFRDEDGFVDTGDIVEQRGDRIFFRGRSNGAINVGGNKLFPEEIERILLEQPTVSEARIFSRPSPITGQLVVGEIVPADPASDHKALAAELLNLCRSRLPRWQVPATLRVVAEIRSNAAGKIERSSL